MCTILIGRGGPAIYDKRVQLSYGRARPVNDTCFPAIVADGAQDNTRHRGIVVYGRKVIADPCCIRPVTLFHSHPFVVVKRLVEYPGFGAGDEQPAFCLRQYGYRTDITGLYLCLSCRAGGCQVGEYIRAAGIQRDPLQQVQGMPVIHMFDIDADALAQAVLYCIGAVGMLFQAGSG